MENSVIQAMTPTIAGVPTWLVIVLAAVVLLFVILGRNDSGRGRRRGRGRRGGRAGGLPILLVIGLLLGATAFGSNIIRTIITTIVEAMNTLGGLYGG